MDENAFPAVTLQLCAALNQANRSYDLLYIPNGTHFYLAEPYFLRRQWDYFVEHLMHQTPPRDYSIGKRSEEHTSELQSLMRISYAVFCLKKKTTQTSNYKQQVKTPN